MEECSTTFGCANPSRQYSFFWKKDVAFVFLRISGAPRGAALALSHSVRSSDISSIFSDDGLFLFQIPRASEHTAILTMPAIFFFSKICGFGKGKRETVRRLQKHFRVGEIYM